MAQHSRLAGASLLRKQYEVTDFLLDRDAAKAYVDLSHQAAHTITFALARLRVIEIVSSGTAAQNSREAAEFRYLLSLSENGVEDEGDESIFQPSVFLTPVGSDLSHARTRETCCR